MSFKKIISILLVFILAYFITGFLKKNTTVNEIFNPKTNVSFSKDTHNFDKLKHNIEGRIYFVYENKGSSDFKIDNIASKCGCTTPNWSRKKLKPNEKDSILVTYDSKQLGYFSKSIYIFSNSETSPDVLIIKGTVLK